MNILLAIAFFVLGTIIGSFLNVVIYRYNTGRGIGGRSHCFSCRKTLTVIDLVPVFSYIFLGGKCRHCHSKISMQYPAVEALTGLLFAGCYFVDSVLLPISVISFSYEIVYHLIVMSFLVVILIYDLKHKIIPDAFAYGFALVALIHMFIGVDPLLGVVILHPSGWHMAAGALLAFPFYVLWLISNGKWMGLGDAKLSLGIGWFLGAAAGGTAIVFGFWIGAAVSLILLAVIKLIRNLRKETSAGFRSKLPHLSIKSEIPFAPFLIAGLLIVFFFGYNIFSNLIFF